MTVRMTYVDRNGLSTPVVVTAQNHKTNMEGATFTASARPAVYTPTERKF